MTAIHSERVRTHFFSYVRKTNACWLWTGGSSNKGSGYEYGQFRLPRLGRRMQAHRFSYLLTGKGIPDGHVLHHECENTRCVNPAHLRPIPSQDHLRMHIVKPCLHGNPKTKCLVCKLPKPKPEPLMLTNRQRYLPIAIESCERKLEALCAEFSNSFGITFSEYRIKRAKTVNR